MCERCNHRCNGITLPVVKLIIITTIKGKCEHYNMNRNYSQFLFSDISKCYEKTSNKLQLFTEAEDKHEHCIENTTGTACIYYHFSLKSKFLTKICQYL